MSVNVLVPSKSAIGAVCALVAALGLPAAMAQVPASAQAGDAARPATGGAANAQRVFKDPVTGRLRAPLPGEAEAAASQAERAAPAQAAKRASTMQSHPMMQRLAGAAAPTARFGGVAQRSDLSEMSFTVVRRYADGSVSSQCVSGPSAAKAAVEGQIAKGEQHDH